MLNKRALWDLSSGSPWGRPFGCMRVAAAHASAATVSFERDFGSRDFHIGDSTRNHRGEVSWPLQLHEQERG
jgi:hypothetical protein